MVPSANFTGFPAGKLWSRACLIGVILLAGCRPQAPDRPGKPAAAARSLQFTARGAFALAEKDARAWNSAALLAEIISGEDISENGASNYWEFRFVDPGMAKEYVVVVEDRQVKESAEGGLSTPVVPLPANWMDSRPAYRKSVAAFFAHHPDPAGFQPDWLICDSRNSSTPHWTLLFSQPKHLPVGSMIHAASGDYLGELSR
jgi:hypothetical protein